MKSIAILGSTGSVGTQTISVLLQNKGQYNVQLLAAKTNWRQMEAQIRVFSPVWAVMADPGACSELKHRVADLPVKVLGGQSALLEVLEAESFDLVVAAMVGHEGLLPILSAINAGSDIALANKEALVMAGHLVTAMCRERKVKLLPLDSEHSAIFQCLEGHKLTDVRKLILTASGGPFRGKTRADLELVTPSMAVKHPNWQMGAKISVDSASLMNKGLEIIEARWLFDVSPDSIEVLIHPQSIIHSMVELNDGSVLAQLGVPSMELPIQYALSWPARWKNKSRLLNWAEIPALSFDVPDYDNFPCLKLARSALVKGGNAPAVLSTANDVCVESFLAGKLGFNAIPELISAVLNRIPWQADPDISGILAAMNQALAETRNLIENLE